MNTSHSSPNPNPAAAGGGPRWQVVRFDVWQHPSLFERFAAAPEFNLVTVKREGDDAGASAALAGADVYVISVAKDELPKAWWANAALLAGSPNLLVVSATGAGYDTVDVAACTAAGVLVVNQSGANARSVAEMTLGLMLGLAHRIGENDRALRGTARGFTREDLMGGEIADKTLGLIGIGNVGMRVAALARAFGMEVFAHDPLLSDETIRARGATPLSLEALLARSDYVSLHCPRDASTMKMMNAERFAAMKRGARFVSTARGGIHDEAALVQALESGHLAGAGLDVWDQEPPPASSPLLRHDKVIATHHTAGVTTEARANMGSWSADQIIGLFRGERPPRVVNPQVWPRFRQRFEARTGIKLGDL